MNALAIITQCEVLPVESFADWLGRGQELASRHRQLGLEIGDWVRDGETQHRDQLELALESIGLDRKFLRTAAKVAEAFPPALRDAALSYDHYRIASDLPRDEALPILQRASQEHWRPVEVRAAVIQRRHDQGSFFSEDDREEQEYVLLIRSWNKARPAARERFLDLAKLANLSEIDDDQVMTDGD